MTEIIRPSVEAFYQASARRDIDRAMSLIADDVDWLVQGPIDVFAFLRAAARKGSRARRAIARLRASWRSPAIEVEALLVDGDRAAAMIRLTSIVRHTGRG